jgi:hypothetical protein
VLDAWFDALEDWPVSQHVFVTAPERDDPDTHEVIHRRAPKAIIQEVEGEHVADRAWNFDRYRDMAGFRNELLVLARAQNPKAFMSIDSDILATPYAEAEPLFDAIKAECGAVSPVVYLGPHMGITNAFYLRGKNHYSRVTHLQPELFRVHVLAACVVMSEWVLGDKNVRYAAHPSGEDFGWSESARFNGYTKWLEPRVTFKHIMKPEDLEKVDARVGW